jgi:hypothetical protein
VEITPTPVVQQPHGPIAFFVGPFHLHTACTCTPKSVKKKKKEKKALLTCIAQLGVVK